MSTPLPDISDLFPAEAQSATHCGLSALPLRKSAPRKRLGIPVARRAARPDAAARAVESSTPPAVAETPHVAETPALTADGNCPVCARVLRVPATGKGEAGWLRLDSRVRVVLIEPESKAVKIKCPQCREMVLF